MNNFKKNIFRYSEEIISPSIPSITVRSEESTSCYGEAKIRVNTIVPVKVNMTGTFSSGASYASTSYLTGVNKKTADIINESISSNTFYNFGIAAADSGGTPNSSNIVFTLNDDVTGDEIISYTFTRNHNITPC